MRESSSPSQRGQRRRATGARRVQQDLTTEKVVLGGILCQGLQAINGSGIDLRVEDFSNPDYGNAYRWLRENPDRWMHGCGNLIDTHNQLDKAGLAAGLGQGSSGVTDLMSVGSEIGPELLKHRSHELIEASVDRQRRKLAFDFAERKILHEHYLEALDELARRDGASCATPRFADFGALAAEGFKREMPSLCQYDESRFLLYPGRVNEVHTEPGVGKTNLALCICGEIMQDGSVVLYLDPEDNANGIGSRFVALGGRIEDLTERMRYVQDPKADEYAGLHAWARQHKPALVVLDGLAEAMAAEGLSEREETDVLTFFRNRIRPFTDVGCAVLISDHVAKDGESRGRWSRGSGAKLGHYDGVSYEVKLKKAYSPDIDGFVRLVVAKDRNGGVGPVGHVATDLHFGHDDEGRPDIRFELPQDEVKQAFKPTHLMEKISRFIEDNGPQSTRSLRDLGNSDYVDKAIAALKFDQHIAVERQGSANMHILKRPYRESACERVAV